MVSPFDRAGGRAAFGGLAGEVAGRCLGDLPERRSDGVWGTCRRCGRAGRLFCWDGFGGAGYRGFGIVGFTPGFRLLQDAAEFFGFISFGERVVLVQRTVEELAGEIKIAPNGGDTGQI